MKWTDRMVFGNFGHFEGWLCRILSWLTNEKRRSVLLLVRKLYPGLD